MEQEITLCATARKRGTTNPDRISIEFSSCVGQVGRSRNNSLDQIPNQNTKSKFLPKENVVSIWSRLDQIVESDETMIVSSDIK